MTNAPLPGARTPIAGNLPATPAFYRFFAALQAAQDGNVQSADLAQIEADIAGLADQIAGISQGQYPILRVLAPLLSSGLLQNGFAQLSWNGTTDDVPEGETNLYYTDARADARIAAHDTLPCFLSDGTPSYLHLASDLTIPCFLSDGTASSLPLAA